MKSLTQQIDRTCATIMAIAFVGIHVPMISIILFGILNGFNGLWPIIVTVLVATLASTLASLAIIFRITRRGAASDDLAAGGFGTRQKANA
jgi:hypothetical protein